MIIRKAYCQDMAALALAPLHCNPVLVAACARLYRGALRAEESAATVEVAWRRAAASQRALRDLQAAKAGLPLPSVVARLARATRRAARTAMSALANIGRSLALSIARAPARAAAFARRNLAVTITKAIMTTTVPKLRIGFGLSMIDHDEWSWSVEQLRAGETTWGWGSDTLAQGCEWSKAEAVAAIKTELAKHGETIESATQLPF
jgi:hypothetical protein